MAAQTSRIPRGPSEIAAWLVEGGARLYALSPRRLSLEELFMRAIREES